MKESNPTTLYLWLTGCIQLNCHFFIDTEIELDLHPGDIQNEEAYIHLVDFLKWLSSATGKHAKLTHEGLPEHVIIEFGT